MANSILTALRTLDKTGFTGRVFVRVEVFDVVVVVLDSSFPATIEVRVISRLRAEAPRAIEADHCIFRSTKTAVGCVR